MYKVISIGLEVLERGVIAAGMAFYKNSVRQFLYNCKDSLVPWNIDSEREGLMQRTRQCIFVIAVYNLLQIGTAGR